MLFAHVAVLCGCCGVIVVGRFSYDTIVSNSEIKMKIFSKCSRGNDDTGWMVKVFRFIYCIVLPLFV